MGYYNKIEEICAESIESYPSIHLYSKYANITLNSAKLEYGEFTSEIDIMTSLNLAIEFFKWLNPRYANYFLNMLSDTQKLISFMPGKANSSMCKADGTVEILYENNIEDVYTIVHEITHKFSHPIGERTELRHIMGEVPTVAMELLLTDFLRERGIEEGDINYRMIKRISGIRECSEHILFEQKLLKIIKTGETLGKNIIKEYMRKSDYKYYLDEIVINDSLQYDYVGRYTLGLLMGLDIYYDVIKSGSAAKLDLLIDILNHPDFTLDEDCQILSGNGILVYGREQKKDFLRIQMEYLEYIKQLKMYLKKGNIKS